MPRGTVNVDSVPRVISGDQPVDIQDDNVEPIKQLEMIQSNGRHSISEMYNDNQRDSNFIKTDEGQPNTKLF